MQGCVTTFFTMIIYHDNGITTIIITIIRGAPPGAHFTKNYHYQIKYGNTMVIRQNTVVVRGMCTAREPARSPSPNSDSWTPWTPPLWLAFLEVPPPRPTCTKIRLAMAYLSICQASNFYPHNPQVLVKFPLHFFKISSKFAYISVNMIAIGS